jgi:hypothetical protein
MAPLLGIAPRPEPDKPGTDALLLVAKGSE